MDKNRIFVDSNYIIALYNPQDSLHLKAQKLARQIKKGDFQLFISNFIFLEIVTIFSQRVGRTQTVKLGKRLLESNELSVLHVNENLQVASWEIFQTIKKKSLSFVDASIIALMRFHDIKNLLTFDATDFSSLKTSFSFKIFA